MELTQRVFRLEQILEGGAAASFSDEPVHYPTMHLDALPEPMGASPPPLAPEEQTGALFAEAPEPVATPAPANMAASASAPARVDASRFQAPATVAPEILPPPKPAMSLENRIGGQRLNRIGIIAVLVGLSYFLKLAFENNWIGPPVRVAIGMVIGLGVLLWSERFRARGFSAFAYSLKAISFGAMYLSLWAAFQFYHLIPAEAAFGAMVAVTVVAAGLSVRQNSELLAAFALVGGFVTPLLVSTNQNREVALLSYLALLDLGTLWIVAIKGWRRILLGSLAGTVLLFGAWASRYYTESQLALTLAFASFFFALYVLSLLLGSVESNRKHWPSAVAVALLNAFCYFAACYAMLFEHYRQEFSGLTAGIALFYFLTASAVWRREAAEKRLIGPLYLALGVGFLTIAIPLRFDRHWVTLGWIVEGGALFLASHLGTRSLLRILGAIALGFGVVRLIALESNAIEPVLINPRFGLYLLAIAALAGLAYFGLHEGGVANRRWAGAAILAINLLALVALHFEVVGYFEPQLRASTFSLEEQQGIRTVFDFTYSAVWMVYGSALMIIGFWKRSAFLRWQAIVLLALTVGKVFLFDISIQERGYRIAVFIVLGVILLAISYFYQRSRAKAAV